MKFVSGYKCVVVFVFLILRILFGMAWLAAGMTKISEKSWFSEPGVFLNEYLTASLEKSNVPDFYKYFIEHAALENVMFFNYAIPFIQIMLGLFIFFGFKMIPSILICLFMHVNFILSGNMNFISLLLYTSAFALLLYRNHACFLSLDSYFKSKILYRPRQRNVSLL